MEKDLSLSFPVELKYPAQAAIFGAISVASFFLPFAIGHPQWLVGTAVNACLFLAAIFLPKKYLFPVAILPSLGVLARGIIFGPLTLFLVYFLPFIWLGNLVLIITFKYLFLKYKYIGAIIGASALKFLAIFLIANIYFKLHFAPALFLQAMGLNQLATALAGGLISYLAWKIYLQRQMSF